MVRTVVADRLVQTYPYSQSVSLYVRGTFFFVDCDVCQRDARAKQCLIPGIYQHGIGLAVVLTSKVVPLFGTQAGTTPFD